MTDIILFIVKKKQLAFFFLFLFKKNNSISRDIFLFISCYKNSSDTFDTYDIAYNYVTQMYFVTIQISIG